MFDLFLSCAKVNISCSLQLPKNLLVKYILAPIMNYILFLAKNHGRPSVSSVSERPKSNKNQMLLKVAIGGQTWW